MILHWTLGARSDLDRIDRHWRLIDPKLAARAADIILHLALSLDQFPERGRPSRIDAATRELVGRFGAGAFILRYQVLGQTIVVVQVRHSKERPDPPA